MPEDYGELGKLQRNFLKDCPKNLMNKLRKKRKLKNKINRMIFAKLLLVIVQNISIQQDCIGAASCLYYGDTVKLKEGYAIYSHKDTDSCLSLKKGKITQVKKMPEGEFLIEIVSGRMKIVYCNLDNVFVKLGQLVTNGQFIGTLKSDSASSGSFFSEIYVSNKNGKIDFFY